MPNINGGLLDGVRRIPSKVRDLIIDGGLPGAPLGYRLRGATQYGPPQTGTWRPGDEVPDRAGNRWVCTAGGTPGTWTASVIAVAPSSDTSGATSATAINAAVGLLPASGGVIKLAPTAPWYIKCGQVAINRSGVYIDASGCYINAVGAGDVFRFYDTNYFLRSSCGGGLTGFPCIDGTNTTGNSSAVHAGDILQLQIDVQVQNFTSGTTSKGVWLDNNYYWTEQSRIHVRASNCTAHVVFDNSTGTTLSANATGSFDRGIVYIFVNQAASANDGVVFQNGAQVVDGQVNIYGNFAGAASPPSSAVLRISGTSAGIIDSVLNMGVELDTSAGNTNGSYTVRFGTSGSIARCSGLLNFSASGTFQASNGTNSNFSYQGVILGDSALLVALYGVAGTAVSGWTGSVDYRQIGDGELVFVQWAFSAAIGTVITAGETIATLPAGYYYPSDSRPVSGNITGGGQANAWAPAFITSSGSFQYVGPAFTVSGGSAFWYGSGTFSTAV